MLVIVKFGPHTYTVVRTHWDSALQQGEVYYEDENGTVYATSALGLAPGEQRQAVLDELAHQAKQKPIPSGELIHIGKEAPKATGPKTRWA